MIYNQSIYIITMYYKQDLSMLIQLLYGLKAYNLLNINVDASLTIRNLLQICRRIQKSIFQYIFKILYQESIIPIQ